MEPDSLCGLPDLDTADLLHCWPEVKTELDCVAPPDLLAPPSTALTGETRHSHSTPAARLARHTRALDMQSTKF